MKTLVIVSTLLIAVTIALLYHFFQIVRVGQFYIQEPNPFILWGEISMLLIILTIGIACLIKAGKGLKGE